MVPLYAARVRDLGTDDYVVIKCSACGHTAELWLDLLRKSGEFPMSYEELDDTAATVYEGI